MGREWPGGQEVGIQLAQIHAPGVAVGLTNMLHFILLEAEVLAAYHDLTCYLCGNLSVLLLHHEGSPQALLEELVSSLCCLSGR